jgi:hypothetical protein
MEGLFHVVHGAASAEKPRMLKVRGASELKKFFLRGVIFMGAT